MLLTSQPFRRALLLATALSLAAALPSLAAAPAPKRLAGAAAGYAGTHFGNGNLPAGCILDRDADNPDNACWHMKVGLNALDSPNVNVAVLVPLSPTAERDMRVARQAVEMWGGGIKHLAEQMNLHWLAKGVKFNVTTKLVPVDANGLPTQAINLVSPKIVVIATNPVGGIGIGIDPVDFLDEVGLSVTGEDGAPCGSIPNPFSMEAWHETPGFDGHHGALGGFYTKQCDGPGGQICFSVNGSIDPVPGQTDMFSIYDLVSHETGHCLTLGHVGDGADGPWGPTPTHDIMAYSSDPVDLAKCVSTLDVEGFALQMSNYLDTNGDRKVDAKDVLVPNDLAGDGLSSFHIQNPKDHWYASATGLAEDCPQPDWSAAPTAPETNWQPATVPTTIPKLSIAAGKSAAGRLAWNATASWVSPKAPPTARSSTIDDATGDGAAPMTDITAFSATVGPNNVKGVITVDALWPSTDGGRATGYGFYVGGRKFDSFVTTQGTSSEVQTIDSGDRFMMPPGTSTWDMAANTVTFVIPRSYLAKEGIHAPYRIFASTGVHIRTKDWVSSLDRAPDEGFLDLAGPPMTRKPQDAPMARKVTTRTVSLKHGSGNTFTPQDMSTYGVPLVPQVGNVHHVSLPIKEQATVAVTLTWDDPASSLDLEVKGGSGQQVDSDSGTVTVTVPWAHRALDVRVIPSRVMSESVGYTLTAKITTLKANADGDAVPDIADVCKTKKGPATGGGCPDTDRDGHVDSRDKCPLVAGLSTVGCPTGAAEKVVALVDGKLVSTTHVMTRHGSYPLSGSVAVKPGRHTLKLVWYAGSKVVKSASRVFTVR